MMQIVRHRARRSEVRSLSVHSWLRMEHKEFETEQEQKRTNGSINEEKQLGGVAGGMICISVHYRRWLHVDNDIRHFHFFVSLFGCSLLRLTLSACPPRGFNRDADGERANLKNKIGHVGPRRCGKDRYDDHGREGGECGDGRGLAVVEGIRLSN
jgi:hypothetical protein